MTVALCMTWGLALAAGLSKEDQKLQTAVTSVNRQAGQSKGQKTVITRLENQFNVDATRIDGLRSQGLGFGEVAIVLALAQKMTGGITDANEPEERHATDGLGSDRAHAGGEAGRCGEQSERGRREFAPGDGRDR
jgi:hypothetical protein